MNVNLARTAPRLVAALNTTPVMPLTSSRSGPEVLVPEVLQHVADRLLSFDDVWLGPNGSRGVPLDPNDHEERWARSISAMMMCAPYSGTGIAYAWGNDATYYDAMLAKGGPYPLAVACQQLCTVALISRGFPRSSFESNGTVGANAGGTSGRPIFAGRWNASRGMLLADKALTAATPVGPGSLYEFYDQTKPPNADGTGDHIAFVLRVHSTAQGKGWNAIQFFDTGGTNTPHRVAPDNVTQLHSTISYDDPWRDTVTEPEPFSGVGIVPASPNGLADAVNRLELSWPLGYARLTLEPATGKGLYYATPILPMCDPDNPKRNFSPAHLMWSLRGYRHNKMIKPTWHVYLPRGSVVGKVLAGGRGKPLRDALPGAKPDAQVPPGALVYASKITADEWGTVRVSRNFPAGPDSLPFDRRSGSVLPPIDSVPAYLRG